ncbi:hypothetical protein [Paenibacillus sp. GXUN7292]|uniref:hypothetical protein n=1 Tax=Paenibacillus sp. GXUN7292 TaxID=3422499 RepID=UPI003D7CB174
MWNDRVYQFERRLEGGCVVGIEGFTYINEKVVRRLGLEHGDLVRPIKRIVLREGIGYRYEFELVKKNPTPSPDRIQVDACMVGEGLKLLNRDREQLFFAGVGLRITERCIMRFKLVIGDLVDVAFPSTNPYKLKVIWKHVSFDSCRVSEHPLEARSHF